MDGMEFVVYAAEMLLDDDAARNAAELFNTTFITPPLWTFPEWFNSTVQSMVDATSAAAESVSDYIGISGGE
jgi:hypothetical protein